jgi:hypothetical protein
VVLALLAGLFLPALTPAKGSQSVWVIGSISLLLCIGISAMAVFQKAVADKIAGVVAGILTLWMVYAFYNAIS